MLNPGLADPDAAVIWCVRELEEGEAKGRVEGEAKGRVEGEAKGRVEGEAKGQTKALLRILAARGLEVSENQRTQILQCTDPETLDRWIDRAVTVRQTNELFH